MFVFGSTAVNIFAIGEVTHTNPSPYVTPAEPSGTVTSAVTVFVFGSIRESTPLASVTSQTASGLAAMPRSVDFTFIADGRDKWGLGFLITVDQLPGMRSPGSLSWGGINNTYFWIDPARGIGGVILMQYLPFADANALATYRTFERGAYQLVSAER